MFCRTRVSPILLGISYSLDVHHVAQASWPLLRSTRSSSPAVRVNSQRWYPFDVFPDYIISADDLATCSTVRMRPYTHGSMMSKGCVLLSSKSSKVALTISSCIGFQSSKGLQRVVPRWCYIASATTFTLLEVWPEETDKVYSCVPCESQKLLCREFRSERNDSLQSKSSQEWNLNCASLIVDQTRAS